LLGAVVFSVLLVAQGMKLLLSITAIIDLDLAQMVIAHLKYTDSTATFLVTTILAD